MISYSANFFLNKDSIEAFLLAGLVDILTKVLDSSGSIYGKL